MWCHPLTRPSSLRLIWCVVSSIITTIITQVDCYDVWYSSPQPSSFRLVWCVVSSILTTITTKTSMMCGIIHHHNHLHACRLVWCVLFITTTIVTRTSMMCGIIHHHNHRHSIGMVWSMVWFITTTIVMQVNWYDVWYHSHQPSSLSWTGMMRDIIHHSLISDANQSSFSHGPIVGSLTK